MSFSHSRAANLAFSSTEQNERPLICLDKLSMFLKVSPARMDRGLHCLTEFAVEL
jgi:hypothetical protein